MSAAGHASKTESAAHSSTTERVVATSAGAIFALAAAALLWWGFLTFAFYGNCEDNCDKPPRTTTAAVHAGLWWALAAVPVLTAGFYLMMRGRRPTRPSWIRSLLLALVWGSVWLAAITGVALAVDGYAAIVLAPALAIAWLPATIAIAVRSRPPGPAEPALDGSRPSGSRRPLLLRTRRRGRVRSRRAAQRAPDIDAHSDRVSAAIATRPARLSVAQRRH